MPAYLDSLGIPSDTLSLSGSSSSSFEDASFLSPNDSSSKGSPPLSPSQSTQMSRSLDATASRQVSFASSATANFTLGQGPLQSSSFPAEGVTLDMLIPWLVVDEEGKRRSLQISYSYHLFFSTSDFLLFIYKFYKNFNSIPKEQRQRIKEILCQLILCTPKQQFSNSLLKETLEFCERLFPDREDKDTINQVKLCIIRKVRHRRIKFFQKLFVRVPPKHPLRFLEYSSEEIAQQLTLIEFSIFKFIHSSEFHNCGWQKDNKLELSPNIVYLTEKFNMLTAWVATQILNSADNLEQVTSLIKRLLRVTQHLIKIGNMNTALSLYAGLTMHPVLRLKHVWSALPLKYKDSVDQIDELASPHQNYSAYRRLFSSAIAEKRSFIPFLPVHLRDLFSTQESNASFIDDQKKLINRDKLLLAGEQIEQILSFQSSAAFDFPPNPQFYADYSIIKPITTEELDTISYSIVPPATADSSDQSEADTKRALINWRSQEVFAWLSNLNDEVSIYSQQFREVDGQTLMGMTSAMLQKLGVDTLGHRKKLLKHIRDLENSCQPAGLDSPPRGSSAGDSSSSSSSSSLSSSSLAQLIGGIEFLTQEPNTWNSLSVQQWLKLNNIDAQERECLIGIDGLQLLEITSIKLSQLGIKVGTAKKIIKQVNFLRNGTLCGLPIAAKNPLDWSVNEVSIFLQIKSLGAVSEIFLREHINGQVLMNLTKDDVGKLVPIVGQKLVLWRFIRELSSSCSSSSSSNQLQVKAAPSGARRVSAPSAPTSTVSPGASPLPSPPSSGSATPQSSPLRSQPSSEDILIEFLCGGERKVIQFPRNVTLMNIRRKLKDELQLQNFNLISRHNDEECAIKSDETLHRVIQRHSNSTVLVFLVRPSSFGDLSGAKKKRSQSQNLVAVSKNF